MITVATMSAVTTMTAVPTMFAMFLRSAVIVAHRRVLMLGRRRAAVVLVRGVMGVFVVLAHRNSLLGCARGSRVQTDSDSGLAGREGIPGLFNRGLHGSGVDRGCAVDGHAGDAASVQVDVDGLDTGHSRQLLTDA